MNKYRSRRFMLALLALVTPCIALIGGVVVMAMGQKIDGLGAALGGFAACAGLVLGGYGFTRSEMAGGRAETPLKLEGE